MYNRSSLCMSNRFSVSNNLQHSSALLTQNQPIWELTRFQYNGWGFNLHIGACTIAEVFNGSLYIDGLLVISAQSTAKVISGRLWKMEKKQFSVRWSNFAALRSSSKIIFRFTTTELGCSFSVSKFTRIFNYNCVLACPTGSVYLTIFFSIFISFGKTKSTYMSTKTFALQWRV